MKTRPDKNGTVWEVDEQGNPIRPVGVQQGGGQPNTLITKRANPGFKYEGQTAAAKAAAAQYDPALAAAQLAKAKQEAAKAAAMMPYDIRKASAEADKTEAELAKIQSGEATKDPIDPQKLANLRALERQIAQVRGMYNKNFKGGNVLDSFSEMFLPSSEKAAFDSAGTAMAETGFGAFRVPGVGSQSDAEGQRFVDAYAPSAADYDSKIEQKLNNLESRLMSTYQAMGIEPEVLGKPQQRNDAPPVVLSGGPSATDKSSRLTGGSQGPQKTLGTARQYSTDDDLSVARRLESLFDSGASIEQINAEAARLNSSIPPAKVVEAVAWRDGIGKYADRKVYPYNKSANIVRPDMTGRRSDTEIMANRALLSPLGTAATTGVNALGLGTLEAIAPEALAQQRETNPIAGFAGDVGGMLGGTSAIAAIGSKAAGRLAPSLLTGGGRAGSVARAVAPDAAYGALYNANIGENPLAGAALGAAGSGAGQLLGKGAQKALGGFRGSPQAQMLEQSGIPLTVGQRAGGILKSTEDAMSSAPILGDLVNMRRAEGLDAFNLNALNEAGRPIGATVAETGEEGLNALRSQVGDAYNRATQGVDVPLDNTFASDMQAVSQRAANLPDDYLAAFNQVGQNRVGPIVQRGKLTGEDYQQTMRGLKTARSNAGKIGTTGFEGEYRDSVTAAMDALKGQMQRGGGQPVVEGLQNADAANRLAKTIEAAQFAAKNDAGGAGVRMFTPAQLNAAAYATQKKFPGLRPFAEMTDAAQMVLPNKIPDSGTARRGASLLLPASLGGTGAGIDQYASGTPWEGAATGLSAGALMLLGGTKGGQKAINAALFKRNKAFKRAGGLLGRRKTRQGLGSVVAAPILIGNE